MEEVLLVDQLCWLLGVEMENKRDKFLLTVSAERREQEKLKDGEDVGKFVACLTRHYWIHSLVTKVAPLSTNVWLGKGLARGASTSIVPTSSSLLHI